MSRADYEEYDWYERDNYDAITIRHLTVLVDTKSFTRPFGFNKTAVKKKRKKKKRK